MRILGVDPGTANCGFALLEGSQDGSARVLDLGTFRSAEDALLRERVAEYVSDLLALIRSSNPALVVAEAPAFPKGAKAAVMVWSAFTGLTAICQARGVELVLRNPGEWRRMLQLPVHKAGRGPKRGRRGSESVCACGAQLPEGWKNCSACRARARAARDAQAARKSDTEELMRQRWPGAVLLMDSVKENAREHAWDALAIATSWTDKATDTGTRRAA